MKIYLVSEEIVGTKETKRWYLNKFVLKAFTSKESAIEYVLDYIEQKRDEVKEDYLNMIPSNYEFKEADVEKILNDSCGILTIDYLGEKVTYNDEFYRHYLSIREMELEE